MTGSTNISRILYDISIEETKKILRDIFPLDKTDPKTEIHVVLSNSTDDSSIFVTSRGINDLAPIHDFLQSKALENQQTGESRELKIIALNPALIALKDNSGFAKTGTFRIHDQGPDVIMWLDRNINRTECIVADTILEDIFRNNNSIFPENCHIAELSDWKWQGPENSDSHQCTLRIHTDTGFTESKINMQFDKYTSCHTKTRITKLELDGRDIMPDNYQHCQKLDKTRFLQALNLYESLDINDILDVDSEIVKESDWHRQFTSNKWSRNITITGDIEHFDIETETIKLELEFEPDSDRIVFAELDGKNVLPCNPGSEPIDGPES